MRATLCDDCGTRMKTDLCPDCAVKSAEKNRRNRPPKQHIHEECGHMLSMGSDWIACALCHKRWQLVAESVGAST